jgi:IS5 family transposase
VENPYRHAAPLDRSSLTRWRQRLGEEQIAALSQESLSVAYRTKAIETKDLERVVVDTTVHEKAVAHPTDARLIQRAIEKLVVLSKREGVELRQRMAGFGWSPALLISGLL